MVRLCTGCDDDCKKVYLCGKCKVVAYCDKECQVKDWPRYKAHCNESTISNKKMMDRYSVMVKRLIRKYIKHNIKFLQRTKPLLDNMILFDPLSNDEIDKLVAKNKLGKKDMKFKIVTREEALDIDKPYIDNIVDYVDSGKLNAKLNAVFHIDISVNSIGCAVYGEVALKKPTDIIIDKVHNKVWAM